MGRIGWIDCIEGSLHCCYYLAAACRPEEGGNVIGCT
jgi:hypothetical protein